ncbi:hypothetical protein SUGI_0541050 [Cryptomeria japonica]|nr:hypothetical protein SUGI_0541050 [Cryptomeria japonica]
MEKMNVLKYIGIVLVWLLLLRPCVGISSLTVWSGPGCDTQGLRFNNCGCFSIPNHGGYEFVYNGQPVYLYNADACQGGVHTILGVTTTDCTGFGWSRVSIEC